MNEKAAADQQLDSAWQRVLGSCRKKRFAIVLGTGPGSSLFILAVNDGKRMGPRARTFSRLGLALTSVHEVYNKRRAIAEADVIFVGGGNTFRY